MVPNPVVSLVDSAGVFSAPLSSWIPLSEAATLGRIFAGLVDDQNSKLAAGVEVATFPAPLSARGSQAGIAAVPLHWLALAKWIGFWVGMDGRIGSAPTLEYGCRLRKAAPEQDAARLSALLAKDPDLDHALQSSRLFWYVFGLCEWFGLTVDPSTWRIVDGPKLAPVGVLFGLGAYPVEVKDPAVGLR